MSAPMDFASVTPGIMVSIVVTRRVQVLYATTTQILYSIANIAVKAAIHFQMTMYTSLVSRNILAKER